MKQNLMKLLMLLSFVGLLSCEKQQEDVSPQDRSDPLIQEAQTYFEANHAGQQGVKVDNANPKASALKSPKWEDAYVKQSKAGIGIVVIPLNTTGKIHYEHSNKLIDLEGRRFLYMYRTPDGSMVTDVVTLLPDANYLTLSKNTVPFSGKIIVEDWSGNFIKAYRYAHDKIYHTKSVSYEGGDKQVMQTNNPVNVNSWTTHCETTDYYYYTDYQDPTYNGSETHCWQEYTGEPDLLKATDYDENTNGGGGGGGGGSVSLSHSEMFEESIDDSNLAPCMQPIMNYLKSITQGVGQIITKFAGNTPGFNWEVKEGALPGGTGSTNPPAHYNYSTGTVTSTFDSKAWPNATELSWARTILHESVHAYLTAYFATNKPGWVASYPQMVQEWGTLQNWNDVHHEEFARSLVNDIAVALEEYGRMNGYNLSQQFYQDMAWGGLQGTSAFINLPLTEQTRISNVIAGELTGKDINGNSIAQKGKTAGC